MFNPSIGNYQLSFYRELVNIKLKIAVLNIFRYIYIKIMDKLKRIHVTWFFKGYTLNFLYS